MMMRKRRGWGIKCNANNDNDDYDKGNDDYDNDKAMAMAMTMMPMPMTMGMTMTMGTWTACLYRFLPRPRCCLLPFLQFRSSPAHLFIIFITFLSYSSAQKLRFWARPMHRQDMLLVKGTCLFFGIWYMIYHQYSSCQAPPPLHARALSLKTTTIKSLTKMSIPSFSRSSCASLMVRSLSSKAASISLRNSCPRLASIAFSIRGRRHQHQKLDYLLILPTWVWETPPPPFFWEKFPNDPYFCHEHLHHHFYFPITLF